MARLFLDIETLPAPPELHELVLATLKTSPDDEEERREAIADTSLRGEFGRILCIGYWKEAGMERPDVLTGEEPDMLRRFWQIAQGVSLYVGHNILDFDLAFIFKRSVIHGVKTLPINFARYRTDPVYDTMRVWSQWQTREKIGLDTLAKVLGLRSSKKDLDGSKVAAWHEAGRDAEIYEYCKDDVRLARDVYRRMTFET